MTFDVTHADESRQNTNDQQDYFDHCTFQYGNGTKSAWTFIVEVPKTPNGHDSIWVIIDRLTKVAHFILVRTYYKGNKVAQLYIDNILRLNGVPSRIVLDRGTQFTARFWKSLHKALGTHLDYSSAYHPQTDGQIERVNQKLENMLRAYALTYGKDYEKSLSFAEFSSTIATKQA